MAIDMAARRTRRALLAGGIGGLAAVVASALGRPLPARAYDGEVMVVGVGFASTAQTGIETTSEMGAALYGISRAPSGWGLYGYADTGYGTGGFTEDGTGVYGHSDHGYGIRGTTYSPDQAAVVAQSRNDGTGLLGLSGGWNASRPARAKTGVYGRADQDADSRGVYGQAATGQGVYGYSVSGQGVRGYSSTGTAVYASTRALLGTHRGYAIRALGRVRFDDCAGVTTIAAGTKSKTIATDFDLTSTTAVVATLQTTAGGTTTVHRCVVNATTNKFTIHLTANATQDAKVAWIVLG